VVIKLPLVYTVLAMTILNVVFWRKLQILWQMFLVANVFKGGVLLVQTNT